MNKELIVNDEYVRTSAERIRLALKAQEDALEDYISLLECILNSAIRSGETHDALAALQQEAKLIRSFGYKGEEIRAVLEIFLQRIDDIDLSLYGG